MNENVKKKPATILFGNSHAQMYGWGLREVLIDKNEQALVIPLNTCLPFIEINSSSSCLIKAKTYLNAILNDENIKIVIIGLTWYVDQLIDEEGNKINDLDFSARIKAINNLISSLKQKGKKVYLLGPVESISSLSGTATDERVITSEPRKGEIIKVETPTTLMGILNFKNNAKVQLFASWDIWKHQHSTIELYGLDGSMTIPDPNYFGGDLKVSKKDSDWEIIDTSKMLLGVRNEEKDENMFANYRGIGLSDMVDAIKNKNKARCSIDLTLHVLEIMEGILLSSKDSSIYKNMTSCDRPNHLSESEINKLMI